MGDKLTFIQQTVLLLVTFGLTTVVGGFLAALIQHRSWRYKWETESAEKIITTARELFQEISRLMDRRLYRADQLYLWSCRGVQPELKAALENYRSAVQEWNDNINRHLSMLQIYFGKNVREKFDFEVGAKFVDVGSLVEQFYRAEDRVADSVDRENIESGIRQLRLQVYHYNILMLSEIESKAKRINTRTSVFEDIRKMF